MMSTLFFFIPKGLFETVKKIGWVPDIHVHGWMAAMLPIYMKHYYKKTKRCFLTLKSFLVSQSFEV
jgi:starch synthase